MQWVATARSFAIVSCVLAASCSSDVEVAASSEGAGTGGEVATSWVASGVGAAGGGGGAVASTGAGGAGGLPCPDRVCATPCPDDLYWEEDAPCPTCACAADIVLPPSVSYPPSWVQASVTVLPDRYVIDLMLIRDDPLYEDDEHRFFTTYELLRAEPSFEPTPAKVTWFLSEHAGAPLVMHPGSHHTMSFLPPAVFSPTAGFLSVRLGDGVLEGYWRFEAENIYFSGPFSAQLPPR